MDAKEILKGNIDDNVSNDNKTWSSNKIKREILENKTDLSKVESDIAELKNIVGINKNTLINNANDIVDAL